MSNTPYSLDKCELAVEDLGEGEMKFGEWTLDGIGALVDGEYMGRPIHAFRVTATIDSEEVGMALGGYSTKPEAGYIGKVEVEDEYRRRGIGTEILHKMTEVFGENGIWIVYTMIASDAGRGLAKQFGFEYDKQLTMWGLDEYWVWTQ